MVDAGANEGAAEGAGIASEPVAAAEGAAPSVLASPLRATPEA